MAIAHYIEIAAGLLAESKYPLDRLPYTTNFDVLYQRFNQLSGKEHSKHEVWWYLLDARKRGRSRSARRRRGSNCVQDDRGRPPVDQRDSTISGSIRSIEP